MRLTPKIKKYLTGICCSAIIVVDKTTSSKDRTVITRQDLSVIREKINEALEAIASEYDAKMTIGNMSYGGSSENVTNSWLLRIERNDIHSFIRMWQQVKCVSVLSVMHR